jgi:hypothetical protein
MKLQVLRRSALVFAGPLLSAVLFAGCDSGGSNGGSAAEQGKLPDKLKQLETAKAKLQSKSLPKK